MDGTEEMKSFSSHSLFHGQYSKIVLLSAILCGFLFPSYTLAAAPPYIFKKVSQLSVPILGLTVKKDKQVGGIVTQVVINFYERQDHYGLNLRFGAIPGRFSPLAQQAVYQAITRASKAAHLDARSWEVFLTFPYHGLTMYGDSLSAMIGLSVLALAKGENIIYGRSLTGTITEDGNIGPVGGVPQKILAAHSEHLDRVLIPEEHDIGDRDWENPFLMHVSHVRTVSQAYFGLTGQVLISSG
jgi:hypothetical protein